VSVSLAHLYFQKLGFLTTEGFPTPDGYIYVYGVKLHGVAGTIRSLTGDKGAARTQEGIEYQGAGLAAVIYCFLY
jgi:hypothetical protein